MLKISGALLVIFMRIQNFVTNLENLSDTGKTSVCRHFSMNTPIIQDSDSYVPFQVKKHKALLGIGDGAAGGSGSESGLGEKEPPLSPGAAYKASAVIELQGRGSVTARSRSFSQDSTAGFTPGSTFRSRGSAGADQVNIIVISSYI